MEDLFSAGFWECVRDYQKADQRYGQAVFNASAFFYPEEARKLAGAPFDPFYSDSDVPTFLEHLGDMLT